MESGAAAGGGAVQPVGCRTRAILQRMQTLLTCTKCGELFKEPHSLPCQHHFCHDCIAESLERHSVCLTCHNQFWAKDLRFNASIASLLENYLRMRRWVEEKAARMSGAAATGGAGERKGGGSSDGEEKGGREQKTPQRPGRGQQRGESSGKGRSPARRGADDSKSSSHTPRRSHQATASRSPVAATSPSVIGHMHPASAFSSSPAPLSAFIPSKSPQRTPMRSSLKDAIAAVNPAVPPSSASASSAVHNGHPAAPIPFSSLGTLPSPPAPFPPPSLAPPGSHSKTFSKQAVAKSAISPTPTVIATALNTPAKLRPASSLAQEKQRVIDSLFDGEQAAAGTMTARDKAQRQQEQELDEDVMEVDAASFSGKKAQLKEMERRKQASINLIGALPATSVASVKQPLSGVKSVHNAPFFPKKPAATLKEFFLREQPSSSQSSPSPVPPFAAPLVPSSECTTDSDGDALMLAADVTALVANMERHELPTQMQHLSALSSQMGAHTAMEDAPVPTAANPASQAPKTPSPPSAMSSLSPKLEQTSSASAAPALSSSALPSHQASSSDDSMPPPPMHGSLSLPRSQLSLEKDSIGSPPPLEMAPPINLYSPAPALWSQAAANSPPDDSPSEMEVDVPPKRSLITQLAAMQAGMVAQPSAPVHPPAPPQPIPAAAAVVAPPAVVEAPPSPPSPALSAISAPLLSIPILTETSVAMPSMGHALSHPPSQQPQQEQAEQQPQQQPTAQQQTPQPQQQPQPAPQTEQLAPSHLQAQSATEQPHLVAQPRPISQPERSASSPFAAISHSPAAATPIASSPAVPPVTGAPPPPPPVAVAPSAPIPATPASTASSSSSPSPALQSSTPTPPPAVVANGTNPAPVADPLQAVTLSIPNEIGAPISPPPSQSLAKGPLILSVTALTPAQTSQLLAFAARVGTFVLRGKHWRLDVTHVISRVHPARAQRLASRSLKYMQGLLMGAWIVGWEWVERSIAAGHWLPETEFEIEGDVPKGASGAPRRSRMRRERGEPRLLKDVKISVDPRLLAGKDPTVQGVEVLVRLGEGVLVPTPDILLPEQAPPAGSPAPSGAPAPSASALASAGIVRQSSTAALTPGPTYLLMRSDAATVYEPKEMQRLGAQVGMLPLNIMWLLDSISLDQLQDVELYRTDLTQAEKAEIRERKEAQQQQAEMPDPAAVLAALS